MAKARDHITALESELVVLKGVRDRLNAVLDPKIAEVTKKLATPEGRAELEELSYCEAQRVFLEATQAVDKLWIEIQEIEKVSESEEGEEAANEDAGTPESSEETVEHEYVEDSDSEVEEESVTTPTQGPAVFSIPIIGGKRDRGEGEEEGQKGAKRTRLEESK